MLEAQSDQLQMWTAKTPKYRQESRSSWLCSALRQRSPRPRALHSSTQPNEHLRACLHPGAVGFWIVYLSIFVLAVTGAIFIIVFTLMAYSVVKFRKRKNDDGREPPPGLRQQSG
jgi:hypothetical protein